MRYALEVIAREHCFSGFLRLTRYRLRHSLFMGGWGPILERERIEYLNSAAAILYDATRDQIVMVEQFRIGALEHGRGAWTLEPVGGVLKTGEDASEVVRREAMEEAGCKVLELEPIGAYHVSPGTAADRVRLFCGHVDAALAGGIHGLREEGEDTRVTVITMGQALRELYSGKIDTSVAIIAVQWLAINRERLRVKWNRLGEYHAQPMRVRAGNSDVEAVLNS
ncbi:NUDIX domain-containing protein [Candidatus Thiosymbion oneisti]|uniref:NUDIX domain-containing protein n=1 Tax=Candidatus Thiosymbion oneisti TaxID=589554 RepID=UPI000B7DB69D|nr:NUDIX domain-containing protein [Candidatus Thiosymbion oneisti]